MDKNTNNNSMVHTVLVVVATWFPYLRVTEPVRSKAILDLILITAQDLLRELAVENNIGSSGHKLI